MASGEVASVGLAMPMRPEPQSQRPHWVPDERDSFITWLRGEFAAANAIIDALCHHLYMVGAPGDYDLVLACIHHRRFNWSSVLHMQQYYSVAEVIMSLQQVGLKKQGQMPLVRPMQGETAQAEKPHVLHDGSHTRSMENGQILNWNQSSQERNLGPVSSPDQHSAVSNFLPEKLEDATRHIENLSIKEVSKSPSPASKFIVAGQEIQEIEGQQVDLGEGLELHGSVFDAREEADLAALVKQSRSSKGDKPSMGNSSSKDLIQFGTIPAELVAEEQKPATCFREETAEAIPGFLQSVIDRLTKLHIIPADKPPDACSIRVLEKGEYVPPHNHHCFDQPIFLLSLESASTLALGKGLKMESTGDVDGAFKLTLHAGSVLVFQGNSAQLVQYGVTPSQKLRILISFGRTSRQAPVTFPPPNTGRKLQAPPVTTAAAEPLAFMHAFPPMRAVVTSPPTLVPVSATVRSPQAPPAQIIQAQGLPVAAFPPSVVPTGWSSSTSPPRVPTSIGTGVFLPPKGTIVYSHQQMNGTTTQRRPFP